MLLLVMESDFDNREYALRLHRRYLRDQPLDRRVNVGAIGADILAIRPLRSRN